MVQTTFRLPDQLYQTLKQEARNRGLSVNAYVINLLWDTVKDLFVAEESESEGGENIGRDEKRSGKSQT